MSQTKKSNFSRTKARSIVEFYPAQLRCTKSDGYYIEYYYREKTTGQMVRQRTYMNRVINAFGSKREALSHVKMIAAELTQKLKEGWTPEIETADSRLYTPLYDLRDIYLKAKARDVRPTTMRNYTSMTKIFNEWLLSSRRGKCVTGNFERSDAVCYMDHVASLGNSNRSYNNTLKGLRAYFSWAVEHCYCVRNPFETIRLKTKEKKRRIPIDSNSRRRVTEFLSGYNPRFLILCKLVYNSAMRPKECLGVRVGDVDLERHHIRVRGEVAKNHHERFATIPRPVVEDLQYIKGFKPDDYLFGFAKDMRPGKRQCPKSRLSKIWIKVREECGLPEEMKLYSLRDTGAMDLFAMGVNELAVQKHFDHSSPEMLSVYTDHFDPSLNETIYNNSPEF